MHCFVVHYWVLPIIMTYLCWCDVKHQANKLILYIVLMCLQTMYKQTRMLSHLNSVSLILTWVNYVRLLCCLLRGFRHQLCTCSASNFHVSSMIRQHKFLTNVIEKLSRAEDQSQVRDQFYVRHWPITGERSIVCQALTNYRWEISCMTDIDQYLVRN